jgi:hypothetical protein
MTRAQVMHAAMRAVREAVGEDVFICGCGAPLGSVIGYAYKCMHEYVHI